MTIDLVAQIVDREPLGATAGNSGNTIERVTVVDGRRLILKRVSPEWDWISRATGDDGRIVAMWERGVFDRMPASVRPRDRGRTARRERLEHPHA